jgi:DNA uptake protein ComE-like DNA-binding protein
MKLRDFFYVQRSDREVIIVLLLVMAVALGILFATGGDEQTPASAQADSTLTATPEGDTTRVPIYYKVEEQATELFAFDPNKADSTQLLRLGLQPWQVRNIYKYRAAGGVYRKKEDFARLYGLTVEKYRQLEPYIRISSDYAPASTLFADDAPAPRPDTLRYPQKLSEGETLDLNAADTTLLRTAILKSIKQTYGYDKDDLFIPDNGLLPLPRDFYIEGSVFHAVYQVYDIASYAQGAIDAPIYPYLLKPEEMKRLFTPYGLELIDYTE